MSLAYRYPSVAILFSLGLFHPHCNRWRQYSYCLSGCGPTACACVCAASGGETQNSETQHFCYDCVRHYTLSVVHVDDNGVRLIT